MIRFGCVDELPEFGGKRVLIVGAGKDGKRVYDELEKRQTHVCAFVDEDRLKCHKDYYKGIETVTPEMALDMTAEVAIICIGTLASLEDEDLLSADIIRKLANMKEESLYVFDTVDYIEREFRQCLSRNGISSSEDYLKIGQLVIPNYLNMDRLLKRTFLVEACDLIMPHFFDERSCIDEGPYEDSFLFLSEPGKVVFDCGANIGLFSAIAAMNHHEVYAFEPIDKAIRELKKIASMYKGIYIEPYALSDSVRKMEMSCSDNISQNRIVNDGCSGDTISVECTTIDCFVETNGIQRIDYIKADIEGAERNMLKGAFETLKRFAPRLALCTYHYDDDPEVLEDIINKSNPDYKVIHKYKKLYAYVE